ncbi:MAG: hypothetical protein NZ954_01115 [Thermofilaceae archaeon]|nr:hypothetical protein [Thermofilaceae archaeon]MCX8180530.1 hypothetical protein [Thermofilaceae archaeon]MDW8003274.1 hypothetical protein [Thermofilaceae archaeon]
MKLKLVSVHKYDYAKVLMLKMRGEKGEEASLELPEKILESIGWRPSINDEVELEASPEVGDLSDWEIALSGQLLKAREGEVTYSCGGLLCTLKETGVATPRNIYLKLRRAR